MNVTATDLLAIAIFTITMMSLLGTMVGLSPVVPAAIAIGLLSGWGIDIGAFQGRFGAYLQVWLRARSPQYRQRVTYHEAGHFLIARLLGFEVTGYAIAGLVGKSLSEILAEANFQGIEGGVMINFDLAQLMGDPIKGNSIEARHLLDRYCTLCMAGIAAEQLMCAGETEGGYDDLQQLRKAIAHLPQPLTQERWALLNAKNMLSDHQDTLIALAAKMQTGADVPSCYAVIDSVDQALRA
jgi:hypothetical protein